MISDYSDFFLFLGVTLILGGIIYLFFFRNFKKIFISDEEISKLKVSKQVPTAKISYPKISISAILLAIIIGGFLFNQFLMWKMSSSGTLNKPFSISINITKKNGK
ncbi:MAG: hypothetical protein M1268_02870 [Patescibacteria group bacterium]|nr:hypothetical protein [Actinomycetota bacterium]MCL5438908.1 hypothetical protein [Patescibacteria group bacterium]